MSAQRLYTWADLAEFPKEIRAELIDGVLHVDGRPHIDGASLVTPSPFARHQRISRRLALAIGNHLEARGGGELFFEIDTVFDDDHVFRPDLIVVTDDQRHNVHGHVQGAPKIVIEILSDPRHDRVIKRALYERFGVEEYWIADPDADRVELHRHVDGVYGKPVLYEPGDILTSPILPGLSIDLSVLFQR